MKIQKADLSDIKIMINKGYTLSRVANKYGVTKAGVSMALKRNKIKLHRIYSAKVAGSTRESMSMNLLERLWHYLSGNLCSRRVGKCGSDHSISMGNKR